MLLSRLVLRFSATSLEYAQETVRAEDRKIVFGLAACGNIPSIESLGVWSNGIGPWSGLTTAGVDLIHCGGLTGVTEMDLHYAIGKISMPADMQLIGYGARKADARLLH